MVLCSTVRRRIPKPVFALPVYQALYARHLLSTRTANLDPETMVVLFYTCIRTPDLPVGIALPVCCGEPKLPAGLGPVPSSCGTLLPLGRPKRYPARVPPPPPRVGPPTPRLPLSSQPSVLYPLGDFGLVSLSLSLSLSLSYLSFSMAFANSSIILRATLLSVLVSAPRMDLATSVALVLVPYYTGCSFCYAAWIAATMPA